MTIRTATRDELPFLEEMLFEAFFWNPNTPRPLADEFLARPEIQRLLAGWGRPGDRAVIAQEDETPIGAAWYRFWTDEDHTYGFVDAETPELGIGVHASPRSKGVGRALMRALIEAARDDGVRTLSLSVDPSNFARRLYESEGFVRSASPARRGPFCFACDDEYQIRLKRCALLDTTDPLPPSGYSP